MTYTYNEEIGTFGTFAFTKDSYEELRNIVEELPESNEEVVTVAPRTLGAFCTILDALITLKEAV